MTLTINRAFGEVIEACASIPRGDDEGTWITRDMIAAYEELHRYQFAHSVECWLDDELVGGIYGIALGQAFFGESMFSRESDASKMAMKTLCDNLLLWGYQFLDCQVHNPHLERMGAKT